MYRAKREVALDHLEILAGPAKFPHVPLDRETPVLRQWSASTRPCWMSSTGLPCHKKIYRSIAELQSDPPIKNTDHH